MRRIFSASTLAVFSALVLGLITGSSLMVVVLEERLKAAYLEIQQLSMTVNQQKASLEQLKKQGPRVFIVKEVEELVDNPDEVLRLAVAEKVHNILKDFIGREVRELDPFLVYHLFDRRIITVGETSVLLTVKALMISEKLMLYVQAVEQKPRP
ncbi:MAG: hypothetical protein ACOY9Y_15830 [Bacillota bacterium]